MAVAGQSARVEAEDDALAGAAHRSGTETICCSISGQMRARRLVCSVALGNVAEDDKVLVVPGEYTCDGVGADAQLGAAGWETGRGISIDQNFC